ncbi:MAG: hypothetical protein GTO53_04285, partial [Planctomycetales bacterium]|nr:hypothetical protein [Planctomycetales bacterium]NIM08375.1 hypothetical protein [Planctomycetales bacterium]NIN07851.1 hypothetical protein [Planctomycetales bacterium]NIN76979.1 hypothetical protein [Planctomycetales bacterium]NIO34163.1 hypothetical protein [Planctomycetales bacterium]
MAAAGRVSLPGRHTDSHHGPVLPMAFQRSPVPVADPGNDPAGSVSTLRPILPQPTPWEATGHRLDAGAADGERSRRGSSLAGGQPGRFVPENSPPAANAPPCTASASTRIGGRPAARRTSR